MWVRHVSCLPHTESDFHRVNMSLDEGGDNILPHALLPKDAPKSAKFSSQISLFLVKGKDAERSQFDFQISNYICKAGIWCRYVRIISLANRAYLLMGFPYVCLFHTSSCPSHSDILRIKTTFTDWRGLRELSKTNSSATISYNPFLKDIKLNLKRF